MEKCANVKSERKIGIINQKVGASDCEKLAVKPMGGFET